MFANKNFGTLEGFFDAIYYPDRESAQRTLDRVIGITASILLVSKNVRFTIPSIPFGKVSLSWLR